MAITFMRKPSPLTITVPAEHLRMAVQALETGIGCAEAYRLSVGSRLPKSLHDHLEFQVGEMRAIQDLLRPGQVKPATRNQTRN